MAKEYKVTPQGSLGILALGHVGLRKWREVAKKANQEKQTEANKENDGKEKK